MRHDRAQDLAPGPYDREWRFKISGTYIFPYGIMLSAYFAYEQGRPFNREIAVTLDQGRRSIAAEKGGSKRYPNLQYLDAASDAYLAPGGFVLPRRAQLGFRFVF